MSWGRARMPLFLATGFALLVARRPEMLLKPEMYAESAPVFYVPTFFNDMATLIATPYAGYLHLVPRIVASVDRLVVPQAVPMLEAFVSNVGIVLIAGFIASDRLAVVLPDRRSRYVLAAMVLATPTAREVLGIEVNLQVYGAAYLVALSAARPATNWVWRAVDTVGVVLAGLSGPFALLLLPLFLIRRTWVSAAVGACAATQLLVALTNPQRSFAVPDISDAAGAVATRINAAVLGPIPGQLLPHALAAGLIVLIVLAAAPERVRAWGPLTFGACVVGGIGLAADGVAEEVSRNALSFERFFVLAPLAVAAIAVTGVTSHRRRTRVSAQLLGMLLLAGVLLHLRVPGLPDGNWPAESSCIGSSTSCVVEVVPRRFSFMWPGIDGAYPPPRQPSEVVNRVLTDR